MIYWLILLIILIILIIWLYFFKNYESFDCGYESNCLRAHSLNDNNYLWLNKLGHGEVLQIEFQEPPNIGNWIVLDDNLWDLHCQTLTHNPNNLVEAHMNAFVYPNRIANLRFTFRDGSILFPTREFFELEAEYFRNNNSC